VLEELDCLECGEAALFERVECPDGHDEDCPDRVCTSCGLVVVTAGAPLPTAG